MQRDDAVLLDIARAARSVIQFKAGMDRAAFLQDIKTQSAVLHQLMVMGEAVKRLSPDYRNRRQTVRLQLLPEEPSEEEDEGEAAIRSLVEAGLLTPPPQRIIPRLALTF